MSTTSGPALDAVAGAFLALTTLTTGLRMYSRQAQKSFVGPDDWTILPAWFFFVGMNATFLVAVQHGVIGPYTQNALGTPYSDQFKFIVAFEAQGTLSEGFTRISALLFFRRIFCVSNRTPWLRRFIHTMIVILVLWTITYIIVPLTQCRGNLNTYAATAAIHSQYCPLGTYFTLGYTISNVILEAIIIILPIPLVIGLHASIQRRLSVLIVFATAFLSLGSEIARLVSAVQVSKVPPADRPSKNTQQCFFWVLGTGSALVAANLPSLFWLFAKIKPEKVLSGLRSAISLRSLSNRSDRSKGSKDSKGSGDNSRGATKPEPRKDSTATSTPSDVIQQDSSFEVTAHRINDPEAGLVPDDKKPAWFYDRGETGTAK